MPDDVQKVIGGTAVIRAEQPVWLAAAPAKIHRGDIPAAPVECARHASHIGSILPFDSFPDVTHLLRVNLAFVRLYRFRESPGNRARHLFPLVLHEVTQPKLGRSEHVGFQRTLQNLPGDLQLAMKNAIRDILEKIWSAWETFPFAIR